MYRRRFIQMMTLAGAGSLATVGAMETRETKTVTWRVKGFTCVTCAVGLETLLRQEKGVRWAKASWPDASVEIRYEPSEVSEARLKGFIEEMGFRAEPQQKG